MTMGTKINPGPNDCYARALPDEPMFVLLARDPDAPRLVDLWVNQRAQQISRGVRPDTDADMLQEAIECADAMTKWRAAHDGEWREPRPAPTTDEDLAARAFAATANTLSSDAPEDMELPDWNATGEHAAFGREVFTTFARAVRSELDAFRPTHRHVKTGNLYQVLHRASDCTNSNRELRPVVVYRSAMGNVWTRDAAEFNDGRFEALVR